MITRPPSSVCGVVMRAFSDTGDLVQVHCGTSSLLYRDELLPSEPEMSKLYTENFIPGAS